MLFSNKNGSLLSGSPEHWTDYNNHIAVLGRPQGMTSVSESNCQVEQVPEANF